MKYLNRTNMPKQITSKQLASYQRAKDLGLSANENYNTSVLGITSCLYKWVDLAVKSNYGSMGTPDGIKLTHINKWFRNGGQRFDDHGDLLSYSGNKHRIQ